MSRIDLQSQADSFGYRCADSLQLDLLFADGRRVGVIACVKFNRGRTGFRRRSDLRRVGIDEQRYANACVGEPAARPLHLLEMPYDVETPLGGELLAALG